MVVMAAGPGCAEGADPGAKAGFGRVHEGVCAALRAARAGDHAGAEREFRDAHGGLHDLAAEVEDTDRAAAARLLEAKQRAESALRAPSPSPLVPEIEAVAAAVAQAIEADGGEPPRSCSA